MDGDQNALILTACAYIAGLLMMNLGVLIIIATILIESERISAAFELGFGVIGVAFVIAGFIYFVTSERRLSSARRR